VTPTEWFDSLAPETRRLYLDTFEAMQTHQGAHAMWGAEVDPEKVNGWNTCSTCGLTFGQMLATVRSGGYACAFSAGFAA